MPSRTLVVLGALVLGIGYFGYVEYPEPCDFPIHVKLYYSLLRLVTNMSAAWYYLGGSYVSIMRSMERDLTIGASEGVEVTTHTFGGVPTTIFRPITDVTWKDGDAPGIMFFHGGGWTIGGVELYGAFARSLAKHSGMKVIFPEYRLAPEHPYPAGLEDCISATLDFAKNSEKFEVNKDKIIFVGDSAGGNLATAVSLSLSARHETDFEPCYMGLIYPLLQMSNFMLPSYRQNARAPMLTPEMVARVVALYMGIHNFTDLIQPMTHNLHMEGLTDDGFAGKIDDALVPKRYKKNMGTIPPYIPSPMESQMLQKYKAALQIHATDPLFSPLSAKDEDIKLLPDTYILTSEFDVLRDDGLMLYERMKSLEMNVKHTNMEFAAHGIINLFGAVEYDKLTDAMLEFINVLKEEGSQC